MRGFDSHFIFRELNKFNVKINVISNWLEKFMTFFLNRTLVPTDCMQFMNSSLDKLVEHLTDDDCKYLNEEFGLKNLELLKQTGVYPYEYMDGF